MIFTDIVIEVFDLEAYDNFIMGGDNFTGTFASALLWDRALSKREAKALSIPENNTGLLSHWRMSEGKGKYLYDNVGENHGIAGDASGWTDSPQTGQTGQLVFYVDGSPTLADTINGHSANGTNQLSIGDQNRYQHFLLTL